MGFYNICSLDESSFFCKKDAHAIDIKEAPIKDKAMQDSVTAEFNARFAIGMLEAATSKPAQHLSKIVILFESPPFCSSMLIQALLMQYIKANTLATTAIPAIGSDCIKAVLPMSPEAIVAAPPAAAKIVKDILEVVLMITTYELSISA